MNDWWWQVITDFYMRVAGSKFHDPGDPPPFEYASGMLNLIDQIRRHPELKGIKPGLHRRTLSLRPAKTTQKIFVKWVGTELYEIEMESGGAIFDLPWDGKIVVPADVAMQALVNCKRHLEAHPN